MPPSFDWRSRAASNAPDAPGRPEYAAEFLRRNRRYHAEYVQLARRIENGAANARAALGVFARRWGLSFRLRAIRPRRHGVVAP